MVVPARRSIASNNHPAPRPPSPRRASAAVVARRAATPPDPSSPESLAGKRGRRRSPPESPAGKRGRRRSSRRHASRPVESRVPGGQARPSSLFTPPGSLKSPAVNLFVVRGIWIEWIENLRTDRY
jgi:hypothetical protein